MSDVVSIPRRSRAAITTTIIRVASPIAQKKLINVGAILPTVITLRAPLDINFTAIRPPKKISNATPAFSIQGSK